MTRTGLRPSPECRPGTNRDNHEQLDFDSKVCREAELARGGFVDKRPGETLRDGMDPERREMTSGLCDSCCFWSCVSSTLGLTFHLLLLLSRFSRVQLCETQ